MIVNANLGKKFKVSFENYNVRSKEHKMYEVHFDSMYEFDVFVENTKELDIDLHYFYGVGFDFNDKFKNVSSSNMLDQLIDAVDKYGEKLALRAYGLFVERADELDLFEYIDALEYALEQRG